MGTITYTLKTPLTAGETRIAEVTLRRPTGKDIRGIGNVANLQNADRLVQLVADLGGLALPEIDAMDGADVMALIEMVSDFFGVAGSAAALPPTS